MREAASFIAARSSNARGGIVVELLRSLRAAVRSWKNRRALARLSDLDDRLLADVGVSRDDVTSALQAPFAVDPSIELRRRSLRHELRGWRD